MPTMRAFIDNPRLDVASQPRHLIAAPIDLADKQAELVPEAYLEQEPLSEYDVGKRVEMVLRDSAAFLVRNGIDAAWGEGVRDAHKTS